MVEFAIGLAAFSLLLLGAISIAGFQEVQRRLAISARQSAFELAWTSGRAAPDAVARDVVIAQLNDAALVNAIGSEELVRSQDISASAVRGQAPGMASGAATAMLLPLKMAGGFLGSDFDLETSTLLSGEVRAGIAAHAELPAPFNNLELELRQPFALLSDAWNAGGPRHVQQRVGGLVPTNALTRLQSLWQPLLAPLSLVEPSLARLCFGIIEADRVPEDRLGAGRSPLPGRCP